MAAMQVPSPCAWSTNHRSFVESSITVLLGGEVRWRNDATSASQPRLRVGGLEEGRWRRTGKYCARFAFRGEPTGEDAARLMEMASLVENLLKLNKAVSEGNQGVGPDVRTRVDALCTSATGLNALAGGMVASGGRVPAHLTATLKALQREFVSVENIVRLATEAGPIIIDVEDELNPVSEVEATQVLTNDDSSLGLVFKEKDEGSEFLVESLTRQSSLQTVAQSEIDEYLMRTPASKDSSSLAAFRREIERRVMEQLAEKNKPPMDSGGASEGQKDRLGNGDASASESTNVLGIVQNHPLTPLRGSRPRRRGKGAVMEEAQSGSNAGELDSLGAQLQLLNRSSWRDLQQQSASSTLETTTISKELKELRNALSMVEVEMPIVKEYFARSKRAETQIEQVKLQRESMVMAQTKLAQVSSELEEKKLIIDTIKQVMMVERESLLKKVRELSDELSKRISAEEVEAAVNNTVHELEMELRKALQRAESMRRELETNENLLRQLQQEWDAERASLRGELGNLKEQLAEVQQEHFGDKTKFMETVEKVKELDDSVTQMQHSMVEAGERRVTEERNLLATVKLLVADMVNTEHGQAKTNSVDFRFSESMKAFEKSRLNDVEPKVTKGLLDFMLSEENSAALRTFLVTMDALVQPEVGKRETIDHRASEIDHGLSGLCEHLEQDLGNTGSIEVGMEMLTKPVITLYYETAWEFAYLHYSADNLGWTKLPGVCMRNDVSVNNVPFKVVDVEGSSIEFVLTDGRGSWDCPPLGGNYHIKNSGTFLLSFGCIEQKK